MKIGIIGGGISGLYISSLLKNNHNVTIFENNNWGGDIQHDFIDNKCYPISTLFAMPGDKILKKELKKLNIKTRTKTAPSIILLGPILFLLIIGIVGLIKSKNTSLKIFSIIYIFSILIISVIAINSYMCNLILCFGGDKNCNSTKRFYNFNYRNIIDILFSGILFPENCGFSKLVESYLNDKNITYSNNKVTNISRNTNNYTFTLDNNQNITFDKCIITCKYDHYKNIISLSDEEQNALSGTEYFDFYSTLIKLPNKLKQPKVKNSLGCFYIEDKVCLLASHKPIEENPNSYIFKKSYKWKMPIVINKNKKQKINKSDKNIYFIGKELSGNGVNSCMKYAEKISKFF